MKSANKTASNNQLSLPLFDSISPLEHYLQVHSNQFGKVFLCKINEESDFFTYAIISKKSKKINQILKSVENSYDFYFSLSEFRNQRTTADLLKINCLFIDLDKKLYQFSEQTYPYNWTNELNRLSAIDKINKFVVLERQLPSPNLFVYTGNGWHLYWLIKEESYHCYKYWSLLQKDLIELLRPIGADPACSDATRIARLAGTLHSETNQKVIFYQNYAASPWKLRTIYPIILNSYLNQFPHRNKTKKTEQKKNRKITKTNPGWKGVNSWYYVVLQDLIKIAEAQNLQKIPYGYRDLWVYSVSVALAYVCNDPQSLANDIIFYSQKYTDLPDKEIWRITGTVRKKANKHYQDWFNWKNEISQTCEELKINQLPSDLLRKRPGNKRYFFTRKKLLEIFEGIIPNFLYDQLRAIIPDSLAAQRKQEQNQRHNHADHPSRTNRKLDPQERTNRRKQRLAANYQEILPLVSQAADLKAKGFTQKEIASRLNLSQQTISRWLQPI